MVIDGYKIRKCIHQQKKTCEIMVHVNVIIYIFIYF